MTKARVFGPVLMIVLGVAMLLSPQGSALDAGANQPDPCATPQVSYVEPCTPDTRPEVTSTTAEVTTTTALVTTTSEAATTTTGLVTTTMGEMPTTAPPAPPTSAVGAAGASRGQALARTGSSTAPMTVVGLVAITLGAGLLVADRRRAHA